jgi:hypothetical protein
MVWSIAVPMCVAIVSMCVTQQNQLVGCSNTFWFLHAIILLMRTHSTYCSRGVGRRSGNVKWLFWAAASGGDCAHELRDMSGIGTNVNGDVYPHHMPMGMGAQAQKHGDPLPLGHGAKVPMSMFIGSLIQLTSVPNI